MSDLAIFLLMFQCAIREVRNEQVPGQLPNCMYTEHVHVYMRKKGLLYYGSQNKGGERKKIYTCLNPKVDTSLFAATANSLQLYHSPRVKILVFKL